MSAGSKARPQAPGLAAGSVFLLGGVQERWHGVYENVSVVDIQSTDTRYFVGTRLGEAQQVVMIRGTANLTNLRLDFKVDPRVNERLGILLHRGFEEVALSIYADLRSYLNKESAVTLAGMSLGGAAAVILGMLLSEDGYRIREIVTFGQPKVTAGTWSRGFPRRGSRTRPCRASGTWDPRCCSWTASTTATFRWPWPTARGWTDTGTTGTAAMPSAP